MSSMKKEQQGRMWQVQWTRLRVVWPPCGASSLRIRITCLQPPTKSHRLDTELTRRTLSFILTFAFQDALLMASATWSILRSWLNRSHQSQVENIRLNGEDKVRNDANFASLCIFSIIFTCTNAANVCNSRRFLILVGIRWRASRAMW